ncbi:NAD(P)H-hydrate epimerase [Roseibium salinum]|nr:NAD(P)H-hydrate epimerase [Roseibium salinum]
MTSNRYKSEAVLLTPEEMGRADRLTVERGVPGIDLMERAGQAVARAAERMVSGIRPILVLCGPGNNGGDGFVAARYLAAAGHSVDVRLIRPAEHLKGDALEAFGHMELPYAAALEGDGVASDLTPALERAELVIDALFGAGLDRPLSGAVLALVEAVNRSGVPVLAVDLPSGLNGADGAILGGAIKARATITFFFREKAGASALSGPGPVRQGERCRYRHPAGRARSDRARDLSQLPGPLVELLAAP